MTNLHKTLNPISREERVKINENWDRIRERFSNLQMQVNILSGKTSVEDVLKELNLAIDNANQTVIDLQLLVDEDISRNDEATQEAIELNNQAIQATLGTITDALNQVKTVVQNAETVTSEAITAKNETLQATAGALSAITQMQSLINDFEPRGAWDAVTDYKKNNMVTVDGETYIALQDNLNKPVTDATSWHIYAKKGERGERGEKGDTGAALSIQGKLTDVSQLPETGSAGQAYTVNGELYVWSENTDEWENVGNIKGEKGERGERGEKGDTGADGADADLTEITQTVTDLNREVTTHLDEIATIEKLGHIKPDGKTITVDPITGVATAIGSTKDLVAIGITDLNDVTDTGVYSFDDPNMKNRAPGIFPRDPANLSTGEYLGDIVSVTKNSVTGVISQTTYRVSNGANRSVAVYSRGYAFGVWGVWNKITNDLIVQEGYKAVYVNYLTGDDLNDGSTKEKAFKTLHAAIGSSKFHSNRLDIIVAGGSGQVHPYNAQILNKHGSTINIRSDGVTPRPIISMISISSVDRIMIKDIDFQSQLNIENCPDFYMQNMNKTSSNGSHVCKVDKSRGVFDTTLFSNGYSTDSAGLHVVNNSNVYCYYVQGGGNAIGIFCDGSLVRKGAGTSITGTTATKIVNGGQII